MSHLTLILSAAFVLTLTPLLHADPALGDARKALEADLTALHQAGEPTSPEDLQVPALPDTANGAIQLLSAAKAIDSSSDTMRKFDELDITSQLSTEQQQIVRMLVSENDVVLDLVDAAIAKGSFDWQIKFKSPLLRTLLPHLAQSRAVAIIVQADAIASHIEGNDDRTLRRIQQLLTVSKAVDQQPVLVSHLVSVGIANLALDALAATNPTLDVSPGTPTRRQAQSLIAELLDETDARAGLIRSLQNERITQADTALAIADGTLPASDLNKLIQNQPPVPENRETAARIALEDARTTMDQTTKCIAALHSPDWPTTKSKFPPLPNRTPERYFASLMHPAFERATERCYATLAARRITAIALAARCYAIDHAGKVPSSLADLSPKYLPSVPTDPFTTGQPIRYLPDQGIIYSVGADMKDDGGKETKPRSRQPDIVVRLRP